MGNSTSASTSNPKVALVVGKGVIGRSLVEYLDGQPEWSKVIIVARSDPDFETRASTIKVDLLDIKDTDAKLGGGAIADVTHVFFCGLAPGGTDDVKTNVALLKNIVDAVDKHAPKLERVLLNEGLKYYGVHLGKFKTPAKEDDPRPAQHHFYHTQEDYMKARAEPRPWEWVAIRPDVVCGYATGQMNLVICIAVYCAIMKELGEPITFPGKAGSFDKLAQVCYAPHLARACEWAATADGAANEAFNVVNGDFFRWDHVWPQFADYFGVAFKGVKTVDLVETMKDKGPVWDRIVAKYDLKPTKLEDLCNWGFANWCWGNEFDIMADTTKIRQAGFHETVDSELMFKRMFDDFKTMRIIPEYESAKAA